MTRPQLHWQNGEFKIGEIEFLIRQTNFSELYITVQLRILKLCELHQITTFESIIVYVLAQLNYKILAKLRTDYPKTH